MISMKSLSWFLHMLAGSLCATFLCESLYKYATLSDDESRSFTTQFCYHERSLLMKTARALNWALWGEEKKLFMFRWVCIKTERKTFINIFFSLPTIPDRRRPGRTKITRSFLSTFAFFVCLKCFHTLVDPISSEMLWACVSVFLYSREYIFGFGSAHK